MEPPGRRTAPLDDGLREIRSRCRLSHESRIALRSIRATSTKYAYPQTHSTVRSGTLAWPRLCGGDWNAVHRADYACAAGLAGGSRLRAIQPVRPLRRRQAAAVRQEQLPADPRSRQSIVLR